MTPLEAVKLLQTFTFKGGEPQIETNGKWVKMKDVVEVLKLVEKLNEDRVST